MKENSELSKKCKQFEKRFNNKTFLEGLPLLARLDGRAFHTFTKDLKRPFDERLTTSMANTAKYLLEEFNADLVYTQSDEITLFWNTKEENKLFFSGKIFKLNSVLAASCSVFFYKEILKNLPEKADKLPVFDCRTWQVTSMQDVSDVFVWRQLDAVRNSVNCLAQSVFKHSELQKKNKKEVLQMLKNKNIIWNNLPFGLQRGHYFHKISVEEEIDFTNREDIPEKHRVKKLVTRSKVVEKDVPILKENDDNLSIIFGV